MRYEIDDMEEVMMKKKTRIIITIVFILIMLVLLVPIPAGTYNNGEAKVYNAVLYRAIKWNKPLPYATEDMEDYRGVGVYFLKGRYMSVDELWRKQLRRIEYTGEWMEKTEEQKRKEEEVLYEDGIGRYGFDISEIYANCFFAEFGLGGDNTLKVKVNGKLSNDYCVGDHIGCEISNVYIDEELGVMEGDLETAENYGDKAPIRMVH